MDVKGSTDIFRMIATVEVIIRCIFRKEIYTHDHQPVKTQKCVQPPFEKKERNGRNNQRINFRNESSQYYPYYIDIIYIRIIFDLLNSYWLCDGGAK